MNQATSTPPRQIDQDLVGQVDLDILCGGSIDDKPEHRKGCPRVATTLDVYGESGDPRRIYLILLGDADVTETFQDALATYFVE